MICSQPEPLRRDHAVEDFSCGEPALDEWLGRYGWSSQAAGSSRVYATTDGTRVVGYYALAAAQVAREDAPRRIAAGQPAHRPIPAILLARLAVDSAHQRRGVGQSLLMDAMLRCEQAAEQIAARVLLVHAKDAAARQWYARFGFEESPTDPLHLMLLMKDLRAFLQGRRATR